MTRRVAYVLLVVLLFAAGCAGGDGDPGPTPAATPVGLQGVDAPFLQAFVAHSERTLELTRAVAGRVTDPQLRTLVAAVEATETDELRTARTWLRDAGRPTAGGRHDHAGHADADDLERLRRAGPAEVDPTLGTLLTAHQRAAADLARAHLAVGGSAPVRELAERVARSRDAQVDLIATLPAAR
ncbi:DUF305 domain-containing protein [Micromonospora endolithica]|uniref:DUF305 domain-containing protein n=1 Tax=Micromonospora endolithica TaxID=230091 RepID=A0A3A9ZL99_9ACTN|nr:DUF305 domain-containing protein [Micromonospora endolithica]RKN49120.1 DUF305 domain-containing protein [Micromonospora endolithica]TWJ23275.1 uncharacterized protein (DUF305 family) [Micromonospora endolithica]